MAIFKARVQSEYAQIPNATLQDKTISFEAKGLLAMLLSMPEDWELVKEWMVKQSPNCGRDKLDRILKELQQAGYIRKEVSHGDKGKFAGVNWFVYPTATLETRIPAKPESGKTATTKETVKQKKQGTKETYLPPTGSTAPEGADSVCSLCLGYEWTHGNQCERCNGTGKEPTCNDGLQVVNSELTTDQPKAPADTAEPVGQTEHEAASTDKPIKTLNVPFDDFWNLYNKKVGRKKSEAKWKRLSNKDRAAIMEHLPNYIRNTPDVQYRKNPETYLNSESWNDELPNMRKPGRPDYPENQGVDSSIHTSQMNPNKPGLRYGEEAQFVTELTDEHKANNEKMRGSLQDLLKGFDE